MAQTNKRKTVVRYDRIIAVAVIFIILIVLLVSCITSCGGDNSTGDSRQLRCLHRSGFRHSGQHRSFRNGFHSIGGSDGI